MYEMIDRALSEEQRMMRDSIRAFVDGEVIPFIRKNWEKEWEMKPENRPSRELLEAAHKIGVRPVIAHRHAESLYAACNLSSDFSQADDAARLAAQVAAHRRRARRHFPARTNRSFAQMRRITAMRSPTARSATGAAMESGVLVTTTPRLPAAPRSTVPCGVPKQAMISSAGNASIRSRANPAMPVVTTPRTRPDIPSRNASRSRTVQSRWSVNSRSSSASVGP